jgi:hypothetical protein
VKSGAGLVTFSDVETAAPALQRVNADYETHSRAARALAENVFSTNKVLPRFLDAAIS